MPFKKTPKQHEAIKLLTSDASNILLFGGSRSGKTAILVYSIIIRALKCPNSEHAILRKHFSDLKGSIWYESLPTIARLINPELERYIQLNQNKADWFITFPNNSRIWFGGLDDKERSDKILGREYATVYLNECSQIAYNSASKAFTRASQRCALRPRVYFDCNPTLKTHWAYQLFVAHLDPIDKTKMPASDYVYLLMNPHDNKDNIAEGYIEKRLETLSSRQRKRFLLGQWLDEVQGALWTIDMIDRNRVSEPPIIVRKTVNIDPAISSGEESDETGITVTGLGDNGHGYLLDDLSGKFSPAEWAKRAEDAFKAHSCDLIVAEKNQGGEMVKHTIHTSWPNAPLKLVHASKGKQARAEPISALNENDRIHFVGCFPELEDQLVSWVPNSTVKSPDRMDSLVWGFTELMLDAVQPNIMVL